MVEWFATDTLISRKQVPERARDEQNEIVNTERIYHTVYKKLHYDHENSSLSVQTKLKQFLIDYCPHLT